MEGIVGPAGAVQAVKSWPFIPKAVIIRSCLCIAANHQICIYLTQGGKIKELHPFPDVARAIRLI